MSTLRKIWDALRGVDRRKLQFEIDMHRLFLLTSYHRQGSESLDALSELGNKLSSEEQQTLVQENVHKQITHIGECLDDILLAEPQLKMPASSKRKKPSGLSFAVGSQAPKSVNLETLGEFFTIPFVAITVPVKTRPLTLSEVSTALKARIGYTLALRSSQVEHEDAGTGVFLAGEVGPGSVVSFYPGVVYSPPQYRYMRGYPRMDIVNSYLVSRYDGLVIDGQPWGSGGESRELWDGSNMPIDPSTETTSVPPVPIGLEDKKTRLWGSVFGAKEAFCARKGSILERRNPLALAHFINHPGKGKQPNVMLCPYDFVFTNPNLRPYIPNVHFDEDEDLEVKRRGLLWMYDKKAEKTNTGSTVVRTLVLVSTKEVSNEELFLNYRLSNHQKWPAWYNPIDSEEDKRRWH
ncbi:hypothetical protein L7F22_002906 [Adiantum nelumboides]|nr:hypothetical protein [Adiantum nelumboides]